MQAHRWPGEGGHVRSRNPDGHLSTPGSAAPWGLPPWPDSRPCHQRRRSPDRQNRLHYEGPPGLTVPTTCHEGIGGPGELPPLYHQSTMGSDARWASRQPSGCRRSGPAPEQRRVEATPATPWSCPAASWVGMSNPGQPARPRAAVRQPLIAVLEPAPPSPADRAPRRPHPPGDLSPGRPRVRRSVGSTRDSVGPSVPCRKPVEAMVVPVACLG